MITECHEINTIGSDSEGPPAANAPTVQNAAAMPRFWCANIGVLITLRLSGQNCY
jgi:hypothetical protein